MFFNIKFDGEFLKSFLKVSRQLLIFCNSSVFSIGMFAFPLCSRALATYCMVSLFMSTAGW